MSETVSSDVEELKSRISRLEKRVKREKNARFEAEKIAEKGLRELYLTNRDLEKRIAETQKVRLATKKSKASANMRHQFLGALTRQVRTPLNGVAGMLELLNRYSLDEQAHIWVSSAVDNSEKLLRLFERLVLFFELGEIKEVEFSEVNLTDLIDKVQAVWTKECILAGKLLVLENQLEDNLVFRSNWDWLLRLLNEIIDNAVRHANPGAIKFKVSVSQLMPRLSIDKPTLLFSIKDSGPGIVLPDNTFSMDNDYGEFHETLGIGYTLISGLAQILDVKVVQLSTSEGVEMIVCVPLDGKVA